MLVKNFFRLGILKTSNGYSMAEIMIILAVVGVMGVGTTSMIGNMLKLSRKNEMNNGVSTYKAALETMLMNEDSWTNTIKATGAAAPAQLSCIWDGDNVECTNGTVINNFDVRDRMPPPNNATPPPVNTPAIYYNASVATTGFTTQGQSCNTYSGAGNDLCPLRYELSARMDCPDGKASCLKPTVTITGTLVSSPATDSSLANRLNLNEYSFEIVKTDETRFEPLEVRYTRFDGGAGYVGTPCTAGTPVPRPLSVIAYDVGSNIVGPIGPNNFTLTSGIYNCEVSASAYEALNGFNVYLSVGGDLRPIGSGFSGYNSTATAVGKIELNLAANTVIQVMHECVSSGPTDTDFDMGIPSVTGAANDYSGGNTFTRVTCIRNK